MLLRAKAALHKLGIVMILVGLENKAVASGLVNGFMPSGIWHLRSSGEEMRNDMSADRRVSAHRCAGTGVETIHDLICDMTGSRPEVAFLKLKMGYVKGEMNLSGRNCRAAPACIAERTPSIDVRFNAQGRTRTLQPATRLRKQRPNQLQRPVRHKLQSLLYDRSAHCGPIRAHLGDMYLTGL
jgi:hypothetical protein